MQENSYTCNRCHKKFTYCSDNTGRMGDVTCPECGCREVGRDRIEDLFRKLLNSGSGGG